MRVPSTLAHRSLAAVGAARPWREEGEVLALVGPTSPGPSAAFAIVDVVSRKWIATVVTAEESSAQVQLLFAEVLDAEGLVAGLDPGPGHPPLLAMSDNCGPMISHATREFFAMLPIAQRLGWPVTRLNRRGSRACSGTSRPTGPTSSSSQTRP